MTMFNREQTKTIERLLDRGNSDFEIAQQICPSDDDPELFLEAVSAEHERHERMSVT